MSNEKRAEQSAVGRAHDAACPILRGGPPNSCNCAYLTSLRESCRAEAKSRRQNAGGGRGWLFLTAAAAARAELARMQAELAARGIR